MKEPVEIIHAHLFTRDFDALLFKRSDGFWMPVSGIVEPNEGYAETAVREIWEETGLVLHRNQVILTDHEFSGISPKGRKILGKTCWALLSKQIRPPALQFNGELCGYKHFSLADAVELLKKRGLPEAREGLVFLMVNEIGAADRLGGQMTYFRDIVHSKWKGGASWWRKPER